MTDPHEIAAKLTEAQREAMVECRYSFFERCETMMPNRSRTKLIAMGLVSGASARTLSGGKSSSNRLTPLGLAVRDVLLAAEKESG